MLPDELVVRDQTQQVNKSKENTAVNNELAITESKKAEKLKMTDNRTKFPKGIAAGGRPKSMSCYSLIKKA